MMSEAIHDLLIRGVSAAQAQQRDEACFYLEWVLRTGRADQEQRAEALFWLAELTEQPEQKRGYLEEILAADPYDSRARRALAILDRRLNPAEIVDPDRLTPGATAPPAGCPQCGGALIFAADGRNRQCERCGWQPGPVIPPETLLAQGIAAVKAGQRSAGRALLEQITSAPAPLPLKLQAWLWLTETYDDVDRKRRCLEAVLDLDPDNAAARKGLQLLGRRLEAPAPLAPEPQTIPNEPPALAARRFICPQCGARLTFAAGSGVLRCDYCGYQLALVEALRSGVEVKEQDFFTAMVTAKGHTRPIGTRSFKCQGCGANFLVAPNALSFTCAYCHSPHIAELPARELIPPEGIIPFVVTQKEAQAAFRKWLKKHTLHDEAQTTALQGLYLPVWTFDIGGVMNWQCEVRRRGAVGAVNAAVMPTAAEAQLVSATLASELVRSGGFPIFYNDIPVPASHTLPADLAAEVENFDLALLIPYDVHYLADWPAEVYEVTVGDASIVARQRAVAHARRSLDRRVDQSIHGQRRNQHWNSAGVVVESYKLILVPVWLTRYRYQEALYTVVINGQRGTVRGQEPPGLIKKLLGGWLG